MTNQMFGYHRCNLVFFHWKTRKVEKYSSDECKLNRSIGKFHWNPLTRVEYYFRRTMQIAVVELWCNEHWTFSHHRSECHNILWVTMKNFQSKNSLLRNESGKVLWIFKIKTLENIVVQRKSFAMKFMRDKVLCSWREKGCCFGLSEIATLWQFNTLN